MTDLQQKIAWFNKLPLKMLETSVTKYERTCPCGSTVWYEYADSEAVRSWLDIHYNHRGEQLTGGYDFTKKIRFSAKGFEMFCEQFGLEWCRTDSQNNKRYFRDKSAFVYCFYENHIDKPIINQYEGTYATFLPN